MSGKRLAPPLTVLCVGVLMAATTLSGFVGAIASHMYHRNGSPESGLMLAGVAGGVVGGAIGSLGWCWHIVRAAGRYLRQTGRSSPWLIVHGTFDGFVAGLVAATILHTTLMLITGAWRGDGAVVGLIGASVCGPGLGVVSGLLAWGAAALAATPNRPNAEAPPP